MRMRMLLAAALLMLFSAGAWAGEEETPTRADAIEARGDDALLSGDVGFARRRFELALKQYRNIDDLHGIVRLYIKNGKAAMLEGGYPLAADYFAQALDLARREGLKDLEAEALAAQATLALESGEPAKARELLDAAEQKGIGGWRMLNQRGRLLMAEGDLDAAQKTLAEALGKARGAPEANAESACRVNLALVALKKGEYDTALTHLNRALTLDKREGAAISIGETLHMIGMVYENKKDYISAHYFYMRAYGVNSTTSLKDRAAEDRGAVERMSVKMKEAPPAPPPPDKPAP